LDNFGFTIPSTVDGVIVLALTLLVLWVVVSIPVYISGELITGGKSGLGDAMGATLGGTLVYLLVLYGLGFLLVPAIGGAGITIAFIVAIVAWLAVYRSSFDTSWIGAVGIVAVGWVVFIIMDAVLISLLGLSLPRFNPF
jgi:hypothetical protein